MSSQDDGHREREQDPAQQCFTVVYIRLCSSRLWTLLLLHEIFGCRAGVPGLGGGGYCHTARDTKPGEEAAGGAVMAVTAPDSSPFTFLWQEDNQDHLNSFI